ncbi:ALF repeat-containing protein [Streptomyces sp. NPDC014623]|uniref:ALF repeat-containing protein n=1 Tax=Streptomyces sp. NPDC014623 TaxID=3364875 RepID=UPI0036F9CE40
MRPTRAVLAVTAGALAPALLFAAPSFAADTVPSPVTASVAKTASGSDSPYDSMTLTELRVEVFTVLGDPGTGPTVREEAVKALETGTAEALRHFLETGRGIAQVTDDRVAVFTVLGDPGTGRTVHEAAVKALEAGTAEALRYFLETGRHDAQEVDDRVAVFTVLAAPGTGEALRAAAIAVLEDGSREALRHFVEVGQYEV